MADVARDERLSEDVVTSIFERWAKKQSRNEVTPE